MTVLPAWGNSEGLTLLLAPATHPPCNHCPFEHTDMQNWFTHTSENLPGRRRKSKSDKKRDLKMAHKYILGAGKSEICFHSEEVVQFQDHLSPQRNTEGLWGPIAILKTVKERVRRQTHLCLCSHIKINVMLKVQIRNVKPVAQLWKTYLRYRKIQRHHQS